MLGVLLRTHCEHECGAVLYFNSSTLSHDGYGHIVVRTVHVCNTERIDIHVVGGPAPHSPSDSVARHCPTGARTQPQKEGKLPIRRTSTKKWGGKWADANIYINQRVWLCRVASSIAV